MSLTRLISLHTLISVNAIRRYKLMASITIRNIDESLKATLRMTAAVNQRSMEEEARQILKRFLLHKKCAEGIGSRIAKRFSKVGGNELPQVPRSLPRQSELPSNDSP
jgi:plasmid stability protein